MIEGGESALAQIDANAFWEPAPHLTNTKHWFNIKPVRANAEWFNSLEPELQECLRTTGEEVFGDVRATSRQQESETLDELRSEGVTVVDEPTDLDVWKTRAATFDEAYFAKHPEAADFIAEVKSYATGE